MKKIMLVLPMVAFALALAITPAFAAGLYYCGCGQTTCCPEVTISNGSTSVVSNMSSAAAISGKNSAYSLWGGANVTTGKSEAVSQITNQSGSNLIYAALPTTGKVSVSNNSSSFAINKTGAMAISGKNKASVGYVSTGSSTGTALIFNTTGFNVIGGVPAE